MSETSSPAAQPGVDCWRDGEFLVLRRGAAFPGHCCAKCGDPVSPVARPYRLSWSPVPVNAIIISAWVLPLAISFAVLRALTSLSVSDSFLLSSLLSILAFAFTMAFVRKLIIRAPVHISLCTRHKRRWEIFNPQWVNMVTFMIFYFSFLWLNGGNKIDSLKFWVLFISLFVPYVVLQLLLTLPFPKFSAKKIDGEYVWIKGCGEAFLASLPEISRK